MDAVTKYEPLPAGADVQVTLMPLFDDPGAGRHKFSVPIGATISEIIDTGFGRRKLKGRPPDERLRVFLSTANVYWPVEADKWHRIKPKADVHVVVRVVPAGLAIPAVLNLLVTVAAKAVAGSIGASLGLSSFATNLLAFAIPPIGGIFSLSPDGASERSMIQP